MNYQQDLKVRAKIKSLDKGVAAVEVVRSAACGSCRNCETKNELMKIPAGKDNFKEGDEVLIVTKSGDVVKASFYLYFLPSLAAMAGFLAGYKIKGGLYALPGALFCAVLYYSCFGIINSGKKPEVVFIEKENSNSPPASL